MLISPTAALADVDQATGGGFALDADILGLVVIPPTPNVTFTATEPDDGFDEVADVVGPVDVLGAATAGVLHVESQASGVFGENHDATVRSEASAADVVVAPLTNGITVEAVSSTCVANGDGASGITEIVDLRVGGNPITIPSTAPNTTIDVPGIATIVINEQFESNVPGVGTGITVNALHITLLGGAGEVIVAQSRCLLAGPNVLIPQIPTLTVDKTALTPSLPAPGGAFPMRVQVTNTSPEAVMLTSLIDNVNGDLDGQGTCNTPVVINPGATYTCQFTETFTGVAGATQTDTVTATVVDIGGDVNPPATASDSATVTITAVVGDVPAISVTKTAVPETLPAPGGTFTYNIRVTNTGAEAVSVTGLNDNIYGNLDTRPGSTCDVPRALAVGAFYDCSFTAPFTGAVGATLTDTVTATAVDVDGDNNTVTATDTATVTIVAVAGDVPAIQVEKTVTPGSLPAPGGNFTFTVTVTNTGNEQVILTGLNDNVYGNLDGEGTCDVPATINVGGNYSCSFVGNFTGAAGATETDTVTATAVDTDGDNNTVTDTDTATVSIQGAGPSVRVEKTANPTSRPEPGGQFTFTVRVVNTGNAAVTIQTINDNVYGNLATRAGSTCGTLINTSVAVGATATCTFTVTFTGDAGDTETNTVTVTGTGITATAGSATISITNAAPMIRVAKDATPASRPEPGGTFTFRVAVSNLTGESVIISSINDNVHGNLNGRGTCDSGGVLAANTTYVCQFDAEFTGVAGDSETDIVTVTVVDDEGTSSSAQGDATVRITPKGTAVGPTIIVNNTNGVTCTSNATTTANSGEYRIAQVNINNNNSCVSSATATGGTAAKPTPTTTATPGTPAARVLARTGQDTARLIALAAALMALGYLLMRVSPKRKPGEY